MATATYLAGRKKYYSPQAMLWSENSGTLSGGFYYPIGTEIGSDNTGVPENEQNTFLITSDHNRSELSFTSNRIQSRQRMINGSMRSYNIADKLTLSTSWQLLPSRSFQNNPNFNSSGESALQNTYQQFTADSGAGGTELLNWYEDHQGPFWVFLAYDNNLNQTKYSQIILMYFADFSYSVVKRSGFANQDLWNINITLEEV